jgi:hypothetical protein
MPGLDLPSLIPLLLLAYYVDPENRGNIKKI